MPSLERVTAWIDGYVTAWNSNRPEDIGRLFSDDAAYCTAPHREPWRGRDGIVSGWLGRREEPGQASFTWRPLVITDDLAIVQGQTSYREPAIVYSNLWVIRMAADGRCTEFTEWWMDQASG
jgi:SnoaL-like domain